MPPPAIAVREIAFFAVSFARWPRSELAEPALAPP
jgi:hypothetical protein